jgi:protein-S-isoprenylcysteine O-methyltransferase Ste14
MLGFLIAFWTTPTMIVGHLIFTVVTTIYMLIAVKYLEEKDLKKFIGEKHEAYLQEVPMIVPFTK